MLLREAEKIADGEGNHVGCVEVGVVNMDVVAKDGVIGIFVCVAILKSKE